MTNQARRLPTNEAENKVGVVRPIPADDDSAVGLNRDGPTGIDAAPIGVVNLPVPLNDVSSVPSALKRTTPTSVFEPVIDISRDDDLAVGLYGQGIGCVGKPKQVGGRIPVPAKCRVEDACRPSSG